jgi:uncharacterized protein (TIGR00255 family)
MIQSMTGFGKSVAELPSKKVTIEVKSLNSKQLDMTSRISPIYREKEIVLRNELMQKLERGKIELVIYVENAGADASTMINIPVFESYYNQVKKVAEHLNISLPDDWFRTLLRLPEVIKNDTSQVDEAEWAVVHEAFERAVEQLIVFRTQEGAMLEKMFEEKIKRIGELLVEVEPFEEDRIERVKARLKDNLSKLTEMEYDKNRFEQELIYYIEKLDVNEEKSRLANHLTYFLDTLHEGRGQGKKLGFIAQEIGREINTLGSKSNQAEMQQIVVRMKDELEQIKEQVLNVV